MAFEIQSQMGLRFLILSLVGLCAWLPAFAITGISAPMTLAGLVRRSTVLVSTQDGWLCTGTLIAPDLVLTAAHCLSDTPESPLEVTFYSSFNGRFKTISSVKNFVFSEWAKFLPVRTEQDFKKIKQLSERINKEHEELFNAYVEDGIASLCGFSEADQHEFGNWESIEKLVHAKIENRKKLKIHGWGTKCDRWLRRLRNLSKRIIDFNKASSGAPEGDLAILQLQESAPAGFRPMKLDLHFQVADKKGTNIILAGYGIDRPKNMLQSGSGHSGRLITGIAQIIKSDDELVSFGGSAITCPGDSGGPVIYLRNGEPVVFAVNSMSSVDSDYTMCRLIHQSDSQSTLLSRYAEWIESVIKISATK